MFLVAAIKSDGEIKIDALTHEACESDTSTSFFTINNVCM